jgi:GMP synthase (glutamine-hydrolysing)
MTRVLVLQHTPFETPGSIGEALTSNCVELETIRVFEGDSVPSTPEAWDGLLVLGGPMAVYEQDRWPHIGEEIRLVKRAVELDIPVLGICLGSQILAAALGAQVAKGPHMEIGWMSVDMTAAAASDPLFGIAPARWMVFHWHGDQIALPEGATLLCSSEVTPCQAFRYGERTYGIQFHPEATDAIVEGMIEGFRDELAEEGIPPEIVLEGAARYVEALKPVCENIALKWAEHEVGTSA